MLSQLISAFYNFEPVYLVEVRAQEPTFSVCPTGIAEDRNGAHRE
jgi:hypothetical protein